VPTLCQSSRDCRAPASNHVIKLVIFAGPRLPTPLRIASRLIVPESSTSRGRPPPLGYPQGKGYSALVEIALQCMRLMCDDLVALSPEHLRLCKAQEPLQAQLAEIFVTSRGMV